MTLTNRLSLFFLAALAAVLALLCVAILAVASWYLHRQTVQALSSGVNTLAAAIEVVPEGVEWEPAERELKFERGPLGQEIAWSVVDDQGREIDGAGDEAAEKTLRTAINGYPLQSASSALRITEENGWRVSQQWLTPQRLHPELAYHPDADPKQPALGITAAISLEPIGALLTRLAVGLATTSALLWLAVALVGRRLVARALLPIRDLALLATGMNAGNLSERLQPEPTGDELESLSHAINGMLDRLAESFQRQRRFTGDAAHQLRTPLTAIIGQAEITLRRDRSTSEYQSVLGKLHRQALHLHDLVESLLFLSRADGEAQLRVLRVVNLSSWLEEYLADWQNRHAQCDLTARIAATTCPVHVQAVLFAELVGILMDNAEKYRDPQTSIVVTLSAIDGAARLTIENAGPQLTSKELAELFTPFCRGEQARLRGVDGAGLGLSIARRLTETFGGTITAEAVPGNRIRFIVELPLALDAEPAVPLRVPQGAKT